MNPDPFAATVDAIVARDPRFERDAYFFVRDALEYTTRQQKKKTTVPPLKSHVSAQQLLEGVRQYALSQYGPMVPTVLEHWRVRSCEDIGTIVFNLIDASEFGKSDQDSIEDFRLWLRFSRGFCPALPPSHEEPGSRRAGAPAFRAEVRVGVSLARACAGS